MLFALALTTPGCASWTPPWGPDRCTPRFDYADGWLGGDAAYSVTLPGGTPEGRRTLWLFGDSFVVKHPGKQPRDRVGAALVHNSIALSHCDGRRFEISYHVARDASGRPVAFFDSGEESPYWWPVGAFVHAGALYVGLLEVERTPARGALGMRFAPSGMSLARIEDPTAPPESWRPRVMKLSSSPNGIPGGAMRVHGDHVLLFGFTTQRSPRLARFLARVPLAALTGEHDDLEPYLETLGAEGDWIPGLRPDAARILMPDSGTEMSVAIHPELPPARRWLAVYGSPLQVSESGAGRAAPSGAIFARTAPGPEGPWSPRVLVHEIREVGLDGLDGAPGMICYAAKEHPAFDAPGRLLITYVCNYADVDGAGAIPTLRRLQRDMDTYVPRVIDVDVPDAFLSPPATPVPVRERPTGLQPAQDRRAPEPAASPASSRDAAPVASSRTRPSAPR